MTTPGNGNAADNRRSKYIQCRYTAQITYKQANVMAAAAAKQMTISEGG